MVDLDSDRILTRSRSPPVSWKNLPVDIEAALRTRLHGLRENKGQETPIKYNANIESAESAGSGEEGDSSGRRRSSMERARRVFHDRVLRDVFLRFVCHLLCDVKRYLTPLSRVVEMIDVVVGGKDSELPLPPQPPLPPLPPIEHDLASLLDVERFVESSSSPSFYRSMCRTQNFTQLVTRMAVPAPSSTSTELERKCLTSFFAACIDLVNVQSHQLSGPSISTPAKQKRPPLFSSLSSSSPSASSTTTGTSTKTVAAAAATAFRPSTPSSRRGSSSTAKSTPLTMADHALLVSVEHHHTLLLEDCVEVTLTTNQQNEVSGGWIRYFFLFSYFFSVLSLILSLNTFFLFVFLFPSISSFLPFFLSHR